MSYQPMLRRSAVLCSVCALALALSNCSDDEKPPSTNAQAGEAGSAAGEAGASPVSVCGMPTYNNACDPVTGAPCDLTAGETCDESEAFGGFKCFPGPNPQGVGENCDTESLFCSNGLRCVFDAQPICYRYCCEDSECPVGPCSTGLLSTAALGLCLDEFATAGAAGAGGADASAGASGSEVNAGSGGDVGAASGGTGGEAG